MKRLICITLKVYNFVAFINNWVASTIRKGHVYCIQATCTHITPNK